MESGTTILSKSLPSRRFRIGDIMVLLGLAAFFYACLSLASHFSGGVSVNKTISLSLSALPTYTLYSLARMLAAYFLSVLFTLFYGRTAAYNRLAEKLMLPLLDVLQSVPILSFLPVVLIGLSSFMPTRLAAEIASVVLIFTSQAWNMTFAWYQSLTTIPKELKEATAIFRLNSFMNFKTLELPLGAIPLIWNSMMSWAGGWFFLMAAEIFTVGQQSFHLPGLGAYLQTAAFQGNIPAILIGLATLILVIILMDQLIWRPLLAWSDHFKLEMVENENSPTSWFLDLMSESAILRWSKEHVFSPLLEKLEQFTIRRIPPQEPEIQTNQRLGTANILLLVIISAAILYGSFQVAKIFVTLPNTQWVSILGAVLATMLRVIIALVIALAWTIPVGYAIGSNPRVAGILQPLVQVVASLPATALFPVLVASLIVINGGLNISAVILMLMGTQWYLLFNIIAGAAAIPQDLKYTSSLIGIRGVERWRSLILPALFPYIITGGITASGGAWNASIVAEYIQFSGQVHSVTGIGSIIAEATASGQFNMLLISTLVMIGTVVLINRLVWRRLYRIAEERYRLE